MGRFANECSTNYGKAASVITYFINTYTYLKSSYVFILTYELTYILT